MPGPLDAVYAEGAAELGEGMVRGFEAMGGVMPEAPRAGQANQAAGWLFAGLALWALWELVEATVENDWNFDGVDDDAGLGPTSVWNPPGRDPCDDPHRDFEC
jgi:hypothetical protein